LIGGANRDRTGDLYNAIVAKINENQELAAAQRGKCTLQESMTWQSLRVNCVLAIGGRSYVKKP
jgi:hypothetical protein